MLSTVLGLIVILPAFAHQTKLDAVRERVQQIYDFPALDDELKTEQEQAVINAGIIPVLDRAAEVERVLQDHIDFALGFGTFSQNALYLAELFLGQNNFRSDAHEELVDTVASFKQWLESLHQRKLISNHAEEQRLVYVGPGADRSTEPLRAIVRFSMNRSLDVPVEPLSGGEVYVQGYLATTVLWMLSRIATNTRHDDVQELNRVQLYSNAVFRLAYRHPEKMDYKDWERKVVVAFIQRTIQGDRERVEKGLLSAESLAEAVGKIQDWMRKRGLPEEL